MLGRILLTISGLGNMLGPFIADFNETHVKNPRWPPHAKFHNGQTMSLGLILGALCLYYTFRRSNNQRDSLRTAAVLGSIYFIAGLSAILYPGSLAVDPEFGTGFPQLPIFVGIIVASWGGYWLESLSM